MNVTLDSDDLRPLVAAVVSETVAELLEHPALASDRLGYSEPEAAELLGLKRYQLRDERLKGRIQSTRVAGKAWYERSELLDYLRRNRQEVRR